MRRNKRAILSNKSGITPSNEIVRADGKLDIPGTSSDTCFRVLEVRKSTDSDPIISKWNIVGNLRVSSDHKIEGWGMMDKLLEHILDYYDGNIVFKPVILLMYWILGMNLKSVEGPSNRWSWSINFGEPVEIKHHYSLLGSQTISYTKNIISTYREHQFSIEFNIKFTPTKRKTLTILEVIQMGNCSASLIRKLGEVLTNSGINYKLEPETGNFTLTA